MGIFLDNSRRHARAEWLFINIWWV